VGERSERINEWIPVGSTEAGVLVSAIGGWASSEGSSEAFCMSSSIVKKSEKPRVSAFLMKGVIRSVSDLIHPKADIQKSRL
jgi:hypothetical protein